MKKGSEIGAFFVIHSLARGGQIVAIAPCSRSQSPALTCVLGG